MIDHVMCKIVEKMAFVVKVISDLLKMSAISSSMHAAQPEKQKPIINIAIQKLKMFRCCCCTHRTPSCRC